MGRLPLSLTPQVVQSLSPRLHRIGADYAAWTDGGKTITWAVGSSFFRLPFDSVVFTTLKSEDEGEDKEKAEAEEKDRKPKPEEIAVVVEQPGTGQRDGRPPWGQARHDARR